MGGAGFVLIPRLPLLKVILFSQVANGVLLPFVLFYMLMLINRKRIMQEYTNALAECGGVVDRGGDGGADGGAAMEQLDVVEQRFDLCDFHSRRCWFLD